MSVKDFDEFSFFKERTRTNIFFAAFGNPLLDLSVNISDRSLLDKYNLQEDGQRELPEETMKALLEDVYGILGLSHLQSNPSLDSGRCVCLINGNHRSLSASIAAAGHFTLEFTKNSPEAQKILEDANLIYIAGFFINNRFPVCKYVVERVWKEMSKVLIYNLGAVYVVKTWKEESRYMAENCDVVFGNAKEFEVLGELCYGLDSAEGCALKLRELYDLRDAGIAKDDVEERVRSFGKIVVMTNDVKPVLVVWGRDKVEKAMVSIPKIPEEKIVDTTGAGDSFTAGFLWALGIGLGIPECVHYACAVASLIIGGVGVLDMPPEMYPPPPELLQD